MFCIGDESLEDEKTFNNEELQTLAQNSRELNERYKLRRFEKSSMLYLYLVCATTNNYLQKSESSLVIVNGFVND